MLNPFPDLLVQAMLAPFILRVALGLIFLDQGLVNLRTKNWGFLPLIGLIEVVGAIMLFLGFYTQIAALAFAIIAGIELYIEWKDANVLKRDLAYYLLTFAIALSLLFSGAGAYAKDLPL